MPSNPALITAAYIVAAASLARAAAISRSGAALGRRWPHRERRDRQRHADDARRTLAWAVMAGLVMLVGLARTTGVTATTGEAIREFAKSTGWYAGRGPWQQAATVAACLACLSLAGAVFRSRRAHRRQRLAVIAIAGLVAVLAVRVISWHDAGSVLVHRIAGVRLSHWMELGSIAALTIAGIVAARPGRVIRAHAVPDERVARGVAD